MENEEIKVYIISTVAIISSVLIPAACMYWGWMQ